MSLSIILIMRLFQAENVEEIETHISCSTLSLLMSYIYIYIYGAPSKARNANVVYISTCVWQRWKPSLCYLLHNISTLYIVEWFPLYQLCENTLPATKVALIIHECISIISLESVLRSFSFGKADNSLFLSDCTMSEHGTYHKSISVLRT